MKRGKIFLLLSLILLLTFFQGSGEAGQGGLHKMPLKGRVFADDFNISPPVVGAKVAVEGTPYVTKTDSRGKFSLPFPAGEVTLTVEKEGYFSDRFTQRIPHGTRFPPGVSIGLTRIPPAVGLFLVGEESYISLPASAVTTREVDSSTTMYYIEGEAQTVTLSLLKFVLYLPEGTVAKKARGEILFRVTGKNRIATLDREAGLMDFDSHKIEVRPLRFSDRFLLFTVAVEKPGRYFFTSMEGESIDKKGYLIEIVR